MATKSFLEKNETDLVLNKIKDEIWDENKPSIAGHESSALCEKILLEKFEMNPYWHKAGPVRLGSWSRGELCAKSDIDLLFIGRESDTKEFVSYAQKMGIKIRARVPENSRDWTQGVEAFDILALFTARAFYPEHELAVQECQKNIKQMLPAQKMIIFNKLTCERREREKRYDSISNFLEPNLKYGHGGLRDLEQAFMIRDLFPEKFNEFDILFKKLLFFKWHFLTIRHYAHLKGGNDILTSQIQWEWAKDKNIATPVVYMGALSRMLSEVSFIADSVAEIAQINNKNKFNKIVAKEKLVAKVKLKHALELLKKSPTLYNQRLIKNAKIILPLEKKQFRIIEKTLHANMKEITLNALFRSQLLDAIFMDFKKIRGLVQHDQYHRYACDTHIWQAMRLVLKTKKRPSELGALKPLSLYFKKNDWEILLLSALFHDLAKGRNGDHSTLGEKLAIQELTKKAYPFRTIIEVAWLVKNHLIMSNAAFRLNPNSSMTWAELYKRGVRGERIYRLAIFTAIDIRATNPDAWTTWKSELLLQLVQSMSSKTGHTLEDFLIQAEKNKTVVPKETLNLLDLGLLSALPASMLIKDMQLALKTKKDLQPRAFRGNKKSIWIRFHQLKDNPGLFLKYTQFMHQLGFSIQEAYVMTDQHLGVYDWFRVKTSRSSAQINNLLKIYVSEKKQNDTDTQAFLRKSELDNQAIMKSELFMRPFSAIDIVSENNAELILSFRGRDQKGVLLCAAKALFDTGFEIMAAKVHTWGQQIDDVFTVRKTAEWNQGLAVLRKTLLNNNLVNKNET